MALAQQLGDGVGGVHSLLQFDTGILIRTHNMQIFGEIH